MSGISQHVCAAVLISTATPPVSGVRDRLIHAGSDPAREQIGSRPHEQPRKHGRYRPDDGIIPTSCRGTQNPARIKESLQNSRNDVQTPASDSAPSLPGPMRSGTVRDQPAPEPEEAA